FAALAMTSERVPHDDSRLLSIYLKGIRPENICLGTFGYGKMKRRDLRDEVLMTASVNSGASP
ncbi:MAG: hypothetical protein KAT53_06275, partial [Dehalococcoidia bacterium]|nr:hypothetical protein [Dehalococcoidia bacterium]